MMNAHARLGALVPLGAKERTKIECWLKTYREADVAWILGLAAIRPALKRGTIRKKALRKLRALSDKAIASQLIPAKKKLVYQFASKERIPLPIKEPRLCPHCSKDIDKEVTS